MGGFSKAVRFVAANFGPLVTFYVVNHFYGLQKAILFSALFTLIEMARKIYRREPIPLLFKFTAGMTLVFGAVDLYFQQSILFKYEAAVTNAFTGLFFGASLLGKSSLLQDLRASQERDVAWTLDRVSYMRWLTGIWTGYFFLKSGAYLWIASRYDLEKSMLIRTVLGTTSFYGLLALSIFGSRLIFPWMKRVGWLPEAEPLAHDVSFAK